MQAYGLSTRVRNSFDDLEDAWEEAIADGTVCVVDQERIGGLLFEMNPMVAEQDDAIRLSLSLIKVGQTPKVLRRLDEHRALHGTQKDALSASNSQSA